jgi:hypothetical protein
MRIRKLAAALAVAALPLGASLALGGSAHAALSTVSAVTHVYNDPDSGNGGTWATDAFDRTVTVTLDSPQPVSTPAGFLAYTATVSDSGTFRTIAGAHTPNQSVPGQKVSHDVDGTMTGGAAYTIIAPAADVLGATFQAALNANFTPLSGAQSTSQWPVQAFTPQAGVLVTLGNWSWTYVTAAGESWTDGSTTGDGNVVADGNITGLLAAPVILPRLSHGHATATSPVRETVGYTQSGAASWDEFYIVGPGAINGHKGWVHGNLGLNLAYYGGLEARHGYTVYYTPVEGQGSSVQIPGTRVGYVYFVS